MKLPLAAALLAAVALPAAAQQPTPSPVVSVAGPTLVVNAEGRVERAPDIADISGGVVTTAPTASAAMQANTKLMSAVVAAVKRAGVADRDVQSAGISLQPQYRYQENQPPQLVGYQASNSVNVQVRRIPDMGKIIDALVAAGANQINGPTFRLQEPDAALDEARTAAVKKARARAELYAAAAGLRVKRILQISETLDTPRPPYPMPVARMAMAEAKDASTPVEPGQVRMETTVSVVFELE